ncbi:MAG: DUF1819 family protein [Tissierellia bacterium]|nr:DUF1819 family protein [Tissierellia bacterium]
MQKYSSTLKSISYLYPEMKKASMLISKGYSLEKAKEKAIEDNIFMINSESRKRQIASTVINRMKILDDFLIEKIAYGDLDTSKQIVLYSILKTDRLFFEFFQEVFKEKITLKDNIITDKDFNLFFQSKREQSEQINSWTEYTVRKLKQVYKYILVESNLAERKKKDLYITRPLMDRSIVLYLKDKGDTIYIQSMLGEI